MADRGDYDIRLEAAAAKEWNTLQGWRLTDMTLQIRGGRGYETESSLAARGEIAVGVERMLRDCRINLIFEGSSEIMHLFMAREAVDKHLQVAGVMIDPKSSMSAKLSALPAILGFYAGWYPPLWLKGLTIMGRYGDWGPLTGHLRFIDRASRKLARSSFHGMVIYQAKMERKQGFLFRAVDIVMELFVMAATISRARGMSDSGLPEARRAQELADLFCRSSRRKVKRLFRDLWANEDTLKNAVAASVLNGEQDWLEHGAVDLGWTPDAFRPRPFSDLAGTTAGDDGTGREKTASAAG